MLSTGVVNFGLRQVGIRRKKVFNVSLHRTATHSFHLMCQRQGVRSQHWPGFSFDAACSPALTSLDRELVWQFYRPHVRACDALSDLPVPLVLPQALRDYPGARFVLIRRSPASWVKSVRRHAEGRELDVMEKFQYWAICGGRQNYISEYSDEELEEGYEKYQEVVSSLMREHDALFDVFDLGSYNLGGRIAAFCGFPGGSAVF